jgi:GDP-L-fucose synthase
MQARERGTRQMKIYLAGHRGMVGGAILRALQARGDGAQVITRSHADLDLTDQAAVRGFMATERPDMVILAAAKVGGIQANNNFPADFIHDNLLIQTNVIGQAHAAGVQRLLFLGSSCIYPRLAPQPMAEDSLLTGTLEPTNEPYAIAKIAGIKLCESFNRQHGRDYRSVMPTNLYGPGDNFHPDNSHVLPALIRRFHAAAEARDASVTIWGTGQPRREFLHVDDMAAASLFVADLPRAAYDANTQPMLSHINVGTGTDVAILDLARMVADVTGFRGAILTDPTKPDGTPRKLMDVSRLTAMGWQAAIPLEQGLADTCAWYRAALTRGDIRAA